ncbi:MAG: 2-C-methyl-D-erythritol 4-phosphate cytidylyltransferase, partial [Quisquiliibacterium sp.]
MTRTERFFAVMPAAGTGTRVGAAVPKQYLELAGKTVVAWSALALLQADWIERVIVVVANGDARAGPALRPLQAEHGARLQILERGGPTRRDSVLAGLQALQESAGPRDWALVHDAARPFL